MPNCVPLPLSLWRNVHFWNRLTLVSSAIGVIVGIIVFIYYQNSFSYKLANAILTAFTIVAIAVIVRTMVVGEIRYPEKHQDSGK